MPQFRTKARAVDLLGKGQIADLPTAITELWKNGYDAYADNLTAEIFLQGYKGLEDSLFLMTDDGKGMSKKDIFDKWLVLGTDSKSRGNKEEEIDAETLWKQPRIKAGEKGIGRLSVAFLGSPMLMLTKKLGHPLQAMFFDWRLLENYNLFLDDVEIPVVDINGSSEFRSKFELLRVSFLKNFEQLKDSEGNLIWEPSQDDLKKIIISSVKKASIADFFEEQILHDIIDLVDDHGTKFIIFEPEDQILNLLNNDGENNDNEAVRSSLAGFTNQFKEERLPVTTHFPIHKEIGHDYDLLTSSGNFFVPSDFELADIIIEGEFDGKGNFSGSLQIYDESIPYYFTNPRKKDNRSKYGVFPIKLGYSQGYQSESKLDESAYNKINTKVENYGALYLYRDGFRVLPYGRTEYDFLEFEKRRSLRAGTAFFSHRRMFGYIELTREINYNLKDKSSREGLINNAPYRAFKNDLESFFKDLAREYFSDKAKQSIFLDKKSELKDQVEAIAKDKKRELEAKKTFTKSLKEYPERFATYRMEYEHLLRELERRVNSSNIIYSEIEQLLDQLQKLDINYHNLLPSISKAYEPTDTQLDILYKYENDLIEFNDTIKKDTQSLFHKVQQELEVKDLKIEFGKQFQRFSSELESIIYQNKQELESKFSELNRDYFERSTRVLEELRSNREQIANSILSKGDVITSSQQIKAKFEFLREHLNRELLPLVNHVKKLSFDIDEELVHGAYKAEYEKIKHQWEQTRETAQLGIAVEIIDHEFNVLYSQINSSIEKLDKGLPQNLLPQFSNLKSSFKSLEDKYSLLSPLYRISGVHSKKISCKSIFEYVQHFFEGKIKEEKIKFTASKEFLSHHIEIKEPVIHTVFINVVNNAIYWLRNAEYKEISFDYFLDTEEVLIFNSGQIIESHRLEKIFELFYSNRPNGRGIGLYLSKQSLNENYLDISASNDVEYNKLNGACFVIKPLI